MDKTVHGWLRKSAQKYGNQEALRMDGETLNYLQLEIRSNQLAHLLNQLGVYKKTNIGLYTQKGNEAITSIYGILKTGATYVPLDVNTNKGGLIRIIEACQIDVLITTPNLLKQLLSVLEGKTAPNQIILMSDDGNFPPENQCAHSIFTYDRINRLPETFTTKVEVDSEDLAAILFTSGSTGNPKGVMLTHRNIHYFIQWALGMFDVSTADRFISHAPLHFDISLLDIFVPLSAGASVVLVPSSKVGNAPYLLQLIEKEQLTFWQSVPSVWMLMIEFCSWQNRNFDSLQHLVFTGERMSLKGLKILKKRFLKTKFYNVYGCTETNDSFIYSVPGEKELIPDPVPIGKPLPYVEYKIVDHDLKPVGRLQEGELIVSSPTVMQGYYGQSNSPGVMVGVDDSSKTFYKTGDSVIEGEDGNLHLCGRTDNIIKTSGQRVNLLEVETHILAHQDVTEAAVFALPDPIVGMKIHAVVVIDQGSTLAEIKLKVFCAPKMSKYAIPQIFFFTEKPLPKTSSGKINRKLLEQSYSQQN